MVPNRAKHHTFRTLPNISDGTYLRKQFTAFSHYFCKKFHYRYLIRSLYLVSKTEVKQWVFKTFMSHYVWSHDLRIGKNWSHSKLVMWFIFCMTIRETYFRIFQDWMPPRDNFYPFSAQLPNVSPPYFIKSSLFHLKMCYFEKYIITKS